MVKVIFNKVKKDFFSVSICGHADLINKKNIVCAGISSVVFGILNSLDSVIKDNYSTNISKDIITITLKPIAKTNFIINVMYIQLKTIENEYPKQIKVLIINK